MKTETELHLFRSIEGIGATQLSILKICSFYKSLVYRFVGVSSHAWATSLALPIMLLDSGLVRLGF
jgi:hypothetical protein